MTDTNNLQAAAMTRAAQIALGELKSIARDQGARFHENRISGLRKAIAEHLARHPEIVEKARRDVELWYGKNRVPKR